MSNCATCAAQLKPDAKFCKGCGAKVQHAIDKAVKPAVYDEEPVLGGLACPSCATQHNPSAKFCRQCGGAMDDKAFSPCDDALQPVPETDDGGREVAPIWKRSWFIPALLGLIAIVGACSWYALKRPSETACAGTDATSRPECHQVVENPITGEAQNMFIVADANVRDAATAKGSNIVTKLLRGVSVNGVMQLGVDGESHWFKLSDGRGFVGATNLSSAQPPELARSFGNMPWNVEGKTDVLAKPEQGSRIVATLANGQATNLSGVTKNGYAEAKREHGGVGYFLITSQNDATGVLSGTPRELALSFNHDTCDFGPDFKSYFDMAVRNKQKSGKSDDVASSYVRLNGTMFGLHPTAVGVHYESSGVYFQEDSAQVVKAFLDHGFRFEKNDEFVGYSLIDDSTSGVGASISDTTGEEVQYGRSSFSCGL